CSSDLALTRSLRKRLSVAATGSRAAGVDARSLFVAGEGCGEKCVECDAQVRVGDFIPSLSSFWFGCHDPAPAKTREVVRDVSACQIKVAGELCRISRAFQEREEDA